MGERSYEGNEAVAVAIRGGAVSSVTRLPKQVLNTCHAVCTKWRFFSSRERGGSYHGLVLLAPEAA